MHCLGPMVMPLLLELNARQSVLHPDIGERCMLLDLSTEEKRTVKDTGLADTGSTHHILG